MPCENGAPSARDDVEVLLPMMNWSMELISLLLYL